MFDREEMPRRRPHGDRILHNFHGCLVWRTEINKLPLARDGSPKLINFCRLPCRPTEVKDPTEIYQIHVVNVLLFLFCEDE
jgi:hypothetical protein